MNDNVELRVGGKIFGGWTRVFIRRSIEQIAGGFVLEVSHRWPGVDIPVGLREGLPCEVRINDELMITGYIDMYEPEVTEKSSFIRVEGRDKTGDLVDCSAIHKSGQWRGATLQQIVSDIAAPFGIKVKVAAGLDQGESFKSFALEDGEKAFDAIDRACRLRAVLCTSTPAGDVLLTDAGTEVAGAAIEEGVNARQFRATHTWKERFSQITLKAQAPGDDDEYGASVAHLKATASDPEINRYRPLIVMADHSTSSSSLKERAAWEVRVRMGRGKRGTCTLVGWRTGKDGIGGELWLPNTTTPITSERMNLDQTMLIVGCTYTLSEKGAFTEVEFARPEAFELIEGIGRSKLSKRLNDKTKKEKKKKSDGFTAPWDLNAPKEYR
ncbi:phage baseplate assembly protein [Variovorax gossypii]